jgi:hypothetical protein
MSSIGFKLLYTAFNLSIYYIDFSNNFFICMVWFGLILWQAGGKAPCPRLFCASELHPDAGNTNQSNHPSSAFPTLYPVNLPFSFSIFLPVYFFSSFCSLVVSSSLLSFAPFLSTSRTLCNFLIQYSMLFLLFSKLNLIFYATPIQR